MSMFASYSHFSTKPELIPDNARELIRLLNAFAITSHFKLNINFVHLTKWHHRAIWYAANFGIISHI